MVSRTTGLAVLLQWGHNVSVVEIWRRTQHPFRPDEASMGPQRFRCGNNSWLRNAFEILPRFNGATTFPLWKYGTYFYVVDSRDSFNGATTFPLWKLQMWINCVSGLIMLQWGHNVSVVEIFWVIDNHSRISFASMGPQRFRCGNPAWHPCTEISCCRFNGATTFPLWKYMATLAGKMDILSFNGATTFPLWKCARFRTCWLVFWFMLQWGHNVSVVEIWHNWNHKEIGL